MLACLLVESDEGVVHDEHAGVCHECLAELQLAQFAAGEEYDVFVEQVAQVEDVVEVLLEGLSLGGVVAVAQVFVLEELAYGGCGAVYLGLVPALLEVVGLVVVASVGVAEGDVLDVVRGEFGLLWREVVDGVWGEEWVGSCYDVHEHGLACGVGAYDGDVFFVVEFEVYGFCHTPGGHTGDAVFYPDNHLILFLFLMAKSFQLLYFVSLTGDFSCMKWQ